ncbi:phage major tail tube protein [Mesorhizobium sp. M2A.F.Ca.ET.039.01.1.1]|uniref:phage major tail tube protein n=1 Tax=Mesorhizobium sp. M2A.F.Ca.ET.039.01.1.1 TaxID=2496746 RepID=UPI000FCCBACB|nr:phage major tail tube protein [Mesorhizobium sp. M2A.F.Ca.ET.039.01.1.1]RWX72605.1 phage tail protein [Mesorhizobium sp. M2A.F.Ca.ET.039.01.1.1]
MSTLFILNASNLFVGDHDPTNSKHLSLMELKLPDLQEIYQDHHAGGARVQIEIEVGVQKMEPTFKLVGFDPALLAEFGLGSKIKNIFTAYGEIIDRRTGQSLEIKAIMEGRLGKVAPDAHQRGEVAANEYAINEMSHYEVWWNGQEKILWDFWTNTWRIDGVDQNEATNRILRVPRAG